MLKNLCGLWILLMDTRPIAHLRILDLFKKLKINQINYEIHFDSSILFFYIYINNFINNFSNKYSIYIYIYINIIIYVIKLLNINFHIHLK